MRLFLLCAFLLGQNVNNYLGPTERAPGNSKLIRVQVLVSDDPNPNGVTIESASFAGTNIPLKPRSDIHGFRGQASFQMKPAKYKLKWIVRRPTDDWPRTINHEEEVTVDPKDLWIQIAITGEKAEIS